MGLLFSFLGSSSERSPAKKHPRFYANGMIESLEQRVLFTTVVQLNSPLLDAPGTVAGSTGAQVLASQSETTNVTFSPPGSNDRTVVAYNDGAVARFGEASGLAMHTTGWAYSDDGGASVIQPNSNPASPVLLPTVPNGTAATGDHANHSLAWDNENATLYMASTSWPNHASINVYSSTDGAQTFPTGADATPSAPTSIGSQAVTYDKPWLAADNYAGNALTGTLYLAYVEVIGNSDTQIFVTSLSPSPTSSWRTPDNPGTPPGFAVPTGNIQLVQSPEILVQPNHWVDVVFIGKDADTGAYGIYLDRSQSPTFAQGWTQTPVLLATFQHTAIGQFDVLTAPVDSTSTGTTITGIPVFPSCAIGTIPHGDTYLYVAWMDGNLTDGSFNGTFGIYNLQYDLSDNLPVGDSSDFGPIGQASGYTDEWMPALTLSPDDSSAFIGFYGGSGVYDPDHKTFDEHYNTFYITGQVGAQGVDWSSATQITNLGGTGQPYFDQPGGPSTDIPFQDDPALWNFDYDGASADYQKFHYSFMETSDEQVHDSGGNLVTLDAQEDVYMANVPIPYTGLAAPPAPGQVTATGGTFDEEPTLTIGWDGSHYDSEAEIYVEYSAAGQGWQPLGDSFAWAQGNSVEFLSVNSGGIPITNYSPDKTYYFRVRAVEAGSGNATSGWSAVIPLPGDDTMLFAGTTNSDTIVLRKDNDGQHIDFTLNHGTPTPVSIISGGSLLVLGEGGDDTITFDLSNGNFLAADNEIDNDGGSMSLKIVGMAANDTVNIVGGGNAPYTFDEIPVNVVAGLLDSLEYDDGGGNDTVSVSGSIPVMVNLSAGDSTVNVSGALPVMLNLSSGDSTNTITNSDSAPVYVVPGTGKITLNTTAGATFFPASTGTGIRQINFAALNISSGAYVILAASGALGDYSNHPNRSVAVIDAGGLNVATGGTLDMGDNDMILNYAPADEAATKTQVFNLLQSGITTNGDWTGTGITSSEAAYDSAVTGTRAIGWADNNDIGYSSFDGVSLSDSNQILIKFTYYGDADLSGTMDGTDLSQYFAGRSGQGTGWDFADFDYDGTPATSTDLTLYFSGVNGYKQFGPL